MVIIGQGSSKSTLGANKKGIVMEKCNVNPSYINKKVSQVVKLPFFKIAPTSLSGMLSCSVFLYMALILLFIHDPKNLTLLLTTRSLIIQKNPHPGRCLLHD